MKASTLSTGLLTGFTLLAAAALNPAAAQTPRTPDGQALYRENCRTCHGATGTPTRRALGQYPKMPTLSDSAFLAARSLDSLVAGLRRGVGRDMKSFRDKLTEAEMLAVSRFVRTLGTPPRTP